MFIEEYAKKSGIGWYLFESELMISHEFSRVCFRDGHIGPSCKIPSSLRQLEGPADQGICKGISHCHPWCPGNGEHSECIILCQKFLVRAN